MGSWWSTKLTFVLLLSIGYSCASYAVTARIVWLHLSDDSFYRPTESYTGYTLTDTKPPERAIQLAIKESSIRARASGVDLVLKTITVNTQMLQDDPVFDELNDNDLVIIDLPYPQFIEVTQRLANRKIALINTRHRQNALRNASCQSNVFHFIPSSRMYADTLTQWLRYRGWGELLILSGESEHDLVALDTFQKSASRVGLKVKDSRQFKTSRNPEFREQNTIRFLSGNLSYDAVVVFDSDSDFSRYIPYQTRLPRPVLGDIGLTARAWHPAAERFGAPQLNQRFNRASALKLVKSDQYPRAMTDEDFSAWAAIKFLTSNLPENPDLPHINAYKIFTDPVAQVDLYKGTIGSIRTWNNQLRQPMFIATHNAVIEIAPIKGFLHPSHYTDTLGTDQSETTCRFNHLEPKS